MERDDRSMGHSRRIRMPHMVRMWDGGKWKLLPLLKHVSFIARATEDTNRKLRCRV